MKNKRTIVYDLRPVIEEIRTSKGLPENLSTEAQLWDEIMKKEAFLMPEQLFPLIKEVHGKEYPRTANIRPLATEYSIERMDTREISSIRADITVLVEEKDIYHFECEMNKDGTMVIRMFEYDVHIAISYAQGSADGTYTLQFPHSAVLYLQNNQTVPDHLSCQVAFQDGTVHKYQVPVIKVQTYSLEEIHQKHLCVLIPFLPLRFRKALSSSNPDKKLPRGELTNFYQQIILILEQEVADGYLTEMNQKTILSLLSKSLIRVFYKEESLLEEVIELTEPILELEFEKVERLKRELIAQRETLEAALEKEKAAGQAALEKEKAAGQAALEKEKAAGQAALEKEKAAGQAALEKEKAAGQAKLDAQQEEINRLKAELEKYKH